MSLFSCATGRLPETNFFASLKETIKSIKAYISWFQSFNKVLAMLFSLNFNSSLQIFNFVVYFNTLITFSYLSIGLPWRLRL